MRAAGVTIDPPRLHDDPGCRQAPEQTLVQALVAQAPVQAFNNAILLRLAGGDVMPLDRTLLLSVMPRMGEQALEGDGRNGEVPQAAGLLRYRSLRLATPLQQAVAMPLCE